MAEWTFLSNHGLALLCVSRDPGTTLREIGDCVGVTERTAHGIVNDLVDSGHLKRFREGNRNRYEIQSDMPMRHPLLDDHMVDEILDVLTGNQSGEGGSSRHPANAQPTLDASRQARTRQVA